MTLKSAETSVVKNRPSIPHGANRFLLQLHVCYIFNCSNVIYVENVNMCTWNELFHMLIVIFQVKVDYPIPPSVFFAHMFWKRMFWGYVTEVFYGQMLFL